jgi:hypothetical protein
MGATGCQRSLAWFEDDVRVRVCVQKKIKGPVRDGGEWTCRGVVDKASVKQGRVGSAKSVFVPRPEFRPKKSMTGTQKGLTCVGGLAWLS